MQRSPSRLGTCCAWRSAGPWRQTEGLLRSLATLLGLDIGIPDHTTFSQRSPGLALASALAQAQKTGTGSRRDRRNRAESGFSSQFPCCCRLSTDPTSLILWRNSER